MEERIKLWSEIIDKLNEVGKNLNTLGNPELQKEDYVSMTNIETMLDGYKKAFK